MSQEAAPNYRVEHHTAYRYSDPVILSHQQLHLTPRVLDYQRIREHEVVIKPSPSQQRDMTDAFGNPVTEIAIEAAHTTLDIIARTTVAVSERRVIEPAETPAWESVRAALAYRAAWHPEPAILEATQFLFESSYTRVKRRLRAYAEDCFEPGRPLLTAATALMAKIHGDIKYDTAATNVTTPVMKFFEQKRGVCQDFAHLMISCLRSTGLAARYISGYLFTRRPTGKPRHVGADASHAWVSLFVPGAGWIDLDPTNNVLPSMEHITVGWGRDFFDVTPLRGVINGGGAQTLKVMVTVEPLQATEAASQQSRSSD
jgi:transglutaminase-like putative cysteine protease